MQMLVMTIVASNPRTSRSRSGIAGTIRKLTTRTAAPPMTYVALVAFAVEKTVVTAVHAMYATTARATQGDREVNRAGSRPTSRQLDARRARITVTAGR